MAEMSWQAAVSTGYGRADRRRLTTVQYRHPVQIYYEDTDFSGAVYHANYLKYFERAREHLFGVDELARMWREDGIGFVVYRADLTFKAPARHGDRLEIRTTAELGSEWRVRFQQTCVRLSDDKELVAGVIELVCVSRDNRLVALPMHVREQLGSAKG